MKSKFILLLAVIALLQNDCNAFRVFQVNGVETMLALENEELKIQCRADTPMAYCGFIHPTGTRYSISGSSLDAGQCSFKTKATVADSGQWRCHIGRKGSIGLEIMQIINVRVVKQLAAIQKNITTVHGKEVTISCATVKGLTPLRYCRFEPPTGKPFSINSDVTAEVPILNRYYFPNNKSLDRGDCAVTIRKVKYEDVGQWSCGAGLDDGKEHLDTIIIEVEGLYTMSTASATGITFGAIGIAAFLVVLGFVVWKKRRFLGSMPDEGNEQELQHLHASPQHQRPAHEPPRSRQGSTHELPQSRQGLVHELPQSQQGLMQELPRSAQGSTHKLLQSCQGLMHEPLRSRQGSVHELSQSQQGLMYELPRSRQGSSHKLPQSCQGLMNEPSRSHQGSTHELPQSCQGLMHEPSRSHQGSTHELPQSRQGSSQKLPRSLRGSTLELSRSRQGSHEQLGSVHDELIRRIPLQGSQPPSPQKSLSAKDVPRVTVKSPSPGTSPLIASE